MAKEIEIPEGYEAKIENNKVIFVPKESEDERIRKWICALVITQRKIAGELIGADEARRADAALAYLEKQKEQRPDIELIQRSWYMEGYHDRKFGNEPKWIIKTEEGGPKYELNPKYGQPISEEQQPAKWSEEDRHAIENCEYAIKETFKDEQNPHRIGTLSWLKALRPQPKEEWTINDAKPGDILHTSSTASSKTFIFKGIRDDEHGTVECFCCYDSEDGFLKGEEELIGWKTDKYRLATPEQCIKLGRIMGKAGYIFYFETNQLRKLN